MKSLFSIIKASCFFKSRKRSWYSYHTKVYNTRGLKSEPSCFRQSSLAPGGLIAQGTKCTQRAFRTKAKRKPRRSVEEHPAAQRSTPLCTPPVLDFQSLFVYPGTFYRCQTFVTLAFSYMVTHTGSRLRAQEAGPRMLIQTLLNFNLATKNVKGVPVTKC